jgi:putative DNA methylase
LCSHVTVEVRGPFRNVDTCRAVTSGGGTSPTCFAKIGEPGLIWGLDVRAALGLINQILDEVLSEQEGEFDPDTRWALAWFEQHAFEEGPYGEAEVLATAKALSVFRAR